jgi:glycerol-3-phosphate dehydrogenase (NAD(P)+)
MMKQQILIIGAGEVGRALSKVLNQRRDAEIKFWDKDPRLSSDKNLGDLIMSSQFIFLCIPSPAMASVISDVKPYLRRKTLVVSLTKGMDRRSGKFSSELLCRRFGKRRIAILAGPMIAEELRTGASTKATVGTTKAGFEKLSQLLAGTSLHIEYSSDIQGTAAAGVLKNIYAMGLGMIDALKLGSNAKGVFVNVALLEIAFLIKKLGGRPETAYMLAGLGDLEATGNSTNSVNRVVGQKIVAGELSKLTSEGLISLEPLVKRMGSSNLPPVLSAIRKTVKNPRGARGIFENLIKNA